MSRLLVEFCGEEHVVTDRLGVGRASDLVLDDNPYLHREAVRLVLRGATWWVRNTGRHAPVEVRDPAGGSTAVVAPGAAVAVAAPRFEVSLRAGPTSYALTCVLEDHDHALDVFGAAALTGVRTLDWGHVELNPDQRRLLLALCEHRLRNPADRAAPPPANRAAAARLGWTLAKYNRKLDHLCEKLARAGVAGVHGDLGLLAADRRARVIDHAVEVRLVSADELDELDRPAA